MDSFYVDSTSGFRQWGAANDYDKTHWVVADPHLLMFTLRHRQGHRCATTPTAASGSTPGPVPGLDYNGEEVTAGGYLGTDLTEYFLIENGLPDRARESNLAVRERVGEPATNT